MAGTQFERQELGLIAAVNSGYGENNFMTDKGLFHATSILINGR